MLPSGHSEMNAYPFKYVDAHMRKISFLKLREAYKKKKNVFSQFQFGLLGN